MHKWVCKSQLKTIDTHLIHTCEYCRISRVQEMRIFSITPLGFMNVRFYIDYYEPGGHYSFNKINNNHHSVVSCEGDKK